MQTQVYRPFAIGVCLSSMLAGCGGSATPSTLIAGEQSQAQKSRNSTSACPCLYAANLNGDSITVYSASRNGNVGPIQEISGYNTELHNPRDVAVDASGNIYALSTASSPYTLITVYAAGATGNVAPMQAISGPSTLLNGPNGIGLNPINGDIYVANGTTPSDPYGNILIFPADANGNVAPSGIIGGSATELDDPSEVKLDASGNIYVSSFLNYVTVYAAGTTGDVAPIQTIKGSRTKLNDPEGLALDSDANIYVANHSNSVSVYAAGANGNVRPLQLIKGRKTKLKDTSGVAVDSSDNIYASNGAGLGGVKDSFVTVYASGATGNVAAIRKLKGTKTALDGPNGITIR